MRFQIEFPDGTVVSEEDIRLALRSHAPEWEGKFGVVQDNPATDEEIEEARNRHGSEEREIDEGAKTSRGDRNDGLWVSAWVWLSRSNCIVIERTTDDGQAVIRVKQEENEFTEDFEYDTPEEKVAALVEARAAAKMLSEENNDAVIYDDTEGCECVNCANGVGACQSDPNNGDAG